MQEFVLGGGRAVLEERRAAASKWQAAARTLGLARREPWIMLGADSRFTGAEAVRLSEAAAVAELAVQFTVPEGTIRQWAHDGETLERFLPTLWDRCLEGLVASQNATEAARAVADLPEEAHGEFDRLIADVAVRLTPPKFRLKARALRERLHPDDPRGTPCIRSRATTRLGRARPRRDVVVRRLLASRCRVPGHAAPRDARSRSRASRRRAPDLRPAPRRRSRRPADRASLRAHDLGLPGHHDPGALPASVPASGALPVLDGVGPIPVDMAKRLAGEADSFVRLLSDPVDGTVLDMEARTRRIPKAMRRWLQQRDRTCTFPGCNRPAVDADLDHTDDVQYGGVTASGNLAHLCRKHHTLKHKTSWRYVQVKATAAPRLNTAWTSPLGHSSGNDPPPF